MGTKTKNIPLQLRKHGELSLEQAQQTVNFTLAEMAAGQKLQSQMHTGTGETLFVLSPMVYALRSTCRHSPIQEGGAG